MIDEEAHARALRTAQAALDGKALDVVVLHVGPLTNLCDYFVIATGTSDRHVSAVVERIERQLREHGIRPLHVEGQRLARWVLLDYGDVVVHVFDAETREYYGLEQLWADAARVPVPMAA